ncbi:MAG: type II secretion system F family protein, partial [Pseudomonadota bacterium]|nr:type II secretion system F family protein [Pseudomonadota bacterium]
LLQSIKIDVASGQPFADVLSKYPHIFDRLYCGLIAASMQSGTLASMLKRIADYLEKSASLKKKIRKALTYPAAILIVSLLVSGLLLFFVVPQFATLFNAYGAKLPLFTRMILALSEFIQEYVEWIIGAIIAMIYTFQYTKKNHAPFQDFLDHIALKTFVLGTLLKKAIIARTLRTLSTTLSSGIPLIDALTATANTSGNNVFTTAFLRIRDDVSNGQNLHQAMQNTQLFPPMIIQMVAIGEEAGSIAAMLDKIANDYEEDVDNTVNTLSTLIEPLIMLILGVVIGSFVLAMYLPVFKLGAVF